MATQSPFSLLDDILGKLGSTLQPPSWAVHEVQHRLVLFLNHVLMQEKEAQARLARQSGRIVSLHWRTLSMRVAATRAGLLECLGAENQQDSSDLRLTVTEESPVALMQAVALGLKPGIKIEGDVQLAAEVNWLADHVRWDVEEDLSRVIGDAPAHVLAGLARQLSGTLRSFMVSKGVSAADGKPSP